MLPPSVPLLETLQITLTSTGVAELAFNRPARYNALSPLAYKDWLTAIQWAAGCESVKVVVLTGRGKYYTSGKELQEPDHSAAGKENVEKARLVTKTLVDELIKFPKLLIAGVNGKLSCIILDLINVVIYIGPAYGFGVTTLALCDVVYTTPEATFTTPFMKLAFCAEGCSSILFPRIMGVSRANEMYKLMGRTFTAQELVDCKFISRIFPLEGFQERVLSLAENAAKFSVEAVAVTKKLIRDIDRQILLEVNENEMRELAERTKSKESQNAVMEMVENAKQKRAAKLAEH
ncbi:MAG: ClpP/crotonase-like domain-containing protein [Benjaminiella poitrasii]|nr:MAG: ClpP/crotonase-like domain-containing protein [Benjaminiella poitrasii]